MFIKFNDEIININFIECIYRKLLGDEYSDPRYLLCIGYLNPNKNEIRSESFHTYQEREDRFTQLKKLLLFKEEIDNNCRK